jgi:hypothetical protein
VVRWGRGWSRDGDLTRGSLGEVIAFTPWWWNKWCDDGVALNGRGRLPRAVAQERGTMAWASAVDQYDEPQRRINDDATTNVALTSLLPHILCEDQPTFCTWKTNVSVFALYQEEWRQETSALRV